jgi:hypothetical protein
VSESSATMMIGRRTERGPLAARILRARAGRSSRVPCAHQGAALQVDEALGSLERLEEEARTRERGRASAIASRLAGRDEGALLFRVRARPSARALARRAATRRAPGSSAGATRTFWAATTPGVPDILTDATTRPFARASMRPRGVSSRHSRSRPLAKSRTSDRTRQLLPPLSGARPRPRTMGLFGMFKKKDPKDMVREWQSKLRAEMRNVDRQVRGARARTPDASAGDATRERGARCLSSCLQIRDR